MAINPSNPFSHLWGSFQSAVNDPEIRNVPGGVQQYVWASVRNDYLGRGENLPAGSFAAVNELLSLAGRQRAAATQLGRAVTEFQRTGIDRAIMAGEHTAADIDARSLNQQANGPDWRVRFEYGVTVDGEPVMLRGTWDPGILKPQSVSGLLDAVEQAAQTLAEDYGYEYAGDFALNSITEV